MSAAVHRLISRANAARDGKNWTEAAAAYRAALAMAPGLSHIWVQLGHAAKEAGDRRGAEDAYREAAARRPDDADAPLHLGHLFNRAGQHAQAALSYHRAFRADPSSVHAASGLHRAVAHLRGRARAEVLAALAPDLAEGLGETRTAAGAPLLFDVSDLLGFFAGGRTPTGIQRVQIQVVSHAMQGDGGARVCCFLDGRDEWLEVPWARLAPLLAASQTGSDPNDPVWVGLLHRLHLQLMFQPPLEFGRDSVLLNLGSSWQLPNYFLHVRDAKRRWGIRYVPMIHDLIPVLAPEHFLRAAVQDVVPWLLGVFTHADHLLAISRSTRQDLLTAAARAGQDLAPDTVGVVPLDADFRTPGLVPAPAAEPGPFVLLVSTVEPRKGHATALEAWSRLIARLGAERVPRLLCVGRKGWLSEPIYRRLEEDEALRSRVEMRSGVSDTELAGLYGACLFTIYPSLYEGWGLPVTEALSYGKPVITTDGSSLPEAGGDFAVYVPADDPASLAAAAERMVLDTGWRNGLAARIASGFRPRSWAEVAAQVGSELARLGQRAGRPVPVPVARLGYWHSLARSTVDVLWPEAGNGEAFRSGTGWAAPVGQGCWTRPDGGRLLVGLPPGCGAVRVGLLLLGGRAALDWCLQRRGGPSATGRLARGGRGWVWIEHDGAGPMELMLWGRPHPEAERDDGGPDGSGQDGGGQDGGGQDGEEPTPGLAGFLLHAVADRQAEMRLLRAIATGELDEVDAYRPPPPVLPDRSWG